MFTRNDATGSLREDVIVPEDFGKPRDKPRPELQYLFLSSDKFPPYRVDVEVLFGRELKKRGHRIDWVLPSGAPAERDYQIEWMGHTVRVGRNRTGNSVLIRLLRHADGIIHDVRMLVRLTRKKRYDFIQVKDKCLSALVALIVARCRGIRFIYWLSYPFPDALLHRASIGAARLWPLYMVSGRLSRFLLYKVVMRRADHVFVQSEQMKRDMLEHGIRGDCMTPVPMGVPMNVISYSDKPERNEESGELRVVYLGTLVRVRRMDFLIRVFALVRARIPQARLYLVGAGSEPEDEELLRREAARLNILGAVVFTGFMPMTEAWEHVTRADVCVSPFYPTPILNSTSPTKLIEYMAFGKAVVANGHPEQSRVISESGGGICVPYDEDAFAEAIVTLLGDRAMRRRMGDAGKRYVQERRTYPTIADFVDGCYRAICGKDAGREQREVAPRSVSHRP